jgi:hypothetical protein
MWDRGIRNGYEGVDPAFSKLSNMVWIFVIDVIAGALNDLTDLIIS